MIASVLNVFVGAKLKQYKKYLEVLLEKGSQFVLS